MGVVVPHFLSPGCASGKHHLLQVELPFFGEAVQVAALRRMRSILEGWEEAHQPHQAHHLGFLGPLSYQQ